MEDLGNEVVGPSRADDPSEWVGCVFQNGAVSMQTRTIQLHWGEIFLAHCAALPLVLRPCRRLHCVAGWVLVFSIHLFMFMFIY